MSASLPDEEGLLSFCRARRTVLQEHVAMEPGALDSLLPWAARLAGWVADRQRGRAEPLVLGVAGAQGSGKTTLQRLLCWILAGPLGRPALGLSIDDLYLTRADRAALGNAVHPLLATRGVPGTHDPQLGLRVLRQLRRAGPSTRTALPRFDKARDERCEVSQWPHHTGRPAVVVFEGWCVGARPQGESDLATAVNDLERNEDPAGVWRRFVNQQLAGPYAPLFSELDALVLLKAPAAECAFRWRLAAEEQTRARLERSGGETSLLMDELQIRRFVALDERITRHMLEEMPPRADVLLELDGAHRIRSARFGPIGR